MAMETTMLDKANSAACSTIGLASLKAKQRGAIYLFFYLHLLGMGNLYATPCFLSSLATCAELIIVVLSCVCVSIDIAYDWNSH